ncbi:MAG: replication-relaxation family protein [Acidobacteria bacterium]|nr:replication-relaxation family protein [Acidobacteriota bacterium]
MLTALRDSDLEILRYCHELRFCTIDHLAELTGRHRQALHLRLQRLIAEKYIYRTKFANPNQKHIYSIGSQGFQHLAYQGVIDLADVPPRLRTNELKPLFLNHTLLVTDIHAALILASRDSQNRLADWREGKQLYESVSFYENGKKKRLPVCPDAFFTIEKKGTQLAFALEADRGTTTRRTFDDKINAYWRFLEQNRQTRAYGVKWFRVVTITLTNARSESLCELANQSIPENLKKYFLLHHARIFHSQTLMNYTPKFSGTLRIRAKYR